MKDEGRVIIMEMTFKEMLNAIEGEVIVQKEEINFNKLCIDTRKIEKKEVNMGYLSIIFMFNI